VLPEKGGCLKSVRETQIPFESRGRQNITVYRLNALEKNCEWDIF